MSPNPLCIILTAHNLIRAMTRQKGSVGLLIYPLIIINIQQYHQMVDATQESYLLDQD